MAERILPQKNGRTMQILHPELFTQGFEARRSRLVRPKVRKIFWPLLLHCASDSGLQVESRLTMGSLDEK
jgi:hypothetical protein